MARAWVIGEDLVAYKKRLVVGITGASGSIYAQRFLSAIKGLYDEIYLILSKSSHVVIEHELGSTVSRFIQQLQKENPAICLCDPNDLSAPPSSGSFRNSGMVIIPCTMGTLGRIASGVSSDLISRSADVCLKERRPLILVVREAPLNLIHLRNMETITEAGGTIFPASPAFYNNPKSMDDLIDHLISRIMQQIEIERSTFPEWGVKG